MKILYNTIFGRVFLRVLVSVSVSKFAGLLLCSKLSKIFIAGFIRRNNIDMSEYEEEDYNSFNDFFIRKIIPGLRAFPCDSLSLPAPSDGRLLVFPIEEDNCFNIKNSKYTVSGLICDNRLAKEFTGGYCLIFRLCPDNYHRYSFIDDGTVISRGKIGGVLHTVRPIAVYNPHYKVFMQNAREYTVMHTENAGKIVQVEIGALFVGKIDNYNDITAFRRGQEKGLFQFGGSTIILLLKKDTVDIEASIISASRLYEETFVKMGSVIGKYIK